MTDPLLAAIRAVPVRCADCGLLSNMEALAGSPPCQPPRLGDRRRGDNAVQAVTTSGDCGGHGRITIPDVFPVRAEEW